MLVIQITIVRSIYFIIILCFRSIKNIKCIFHCILVAHIYFVWPSMELLKLVMWGEKWGDWVRYEGGGVILSNCCIWEVFWLCWWWMKEFISDWWGGECCWDTCIICWYVGLVELSWSCWLALAYATCCWCGVKKWALLSWCVLRVV